MILRKMLSLLLVVTFILTTFGSITASANSVNQALANNPTATLSMIDNMNLPALPDSVAKDVRGANLASDAFGVILAISYSYKISYSALGSALWQIKNYYGWSWTAASASSKALGWEIGRAMAIRDGYGDIGPFYSPTNIARLLPWYVQMGTNIVRSNI